MELLESGYKFRESQKILPDNANSKFKGMCESMNIIFKLTAAEAPLSNRLVEIHKLIIADMLDKVLQESNIDINVALSWCRNSKNSLANVHGFSPFQLALGQNPKLLSTFINKPPAYMQISTSKILTDSFTALHRAKEAFITDKNSEKIRRALNHKVRKSENIKYIT